MSNKVQAIGARLGIIVLLAIGFVSTGFAQQFQRGVHSWPDTIATVTVSGVVVVDESGVRPMYYLDVDQDAVIDYHLSFGPWWYEATSGAVRPEDGDEVEIVGALMELEDALYETILVFEIDGLIWRTPVEVGTEGINSEPVWDSQSDAIVNVTGVVLVDTSYFYEHYFLDVTGDAIPEYKLGFGPYWYEPASGAVRPEDGAEVTIVGRLHELDGIDLITVFEIDGLVWREANEPAPWAGEWIPTAQGDTVRVRARNSQGSWIDFPPGYMGEDSGGNGGGGQHGNMPWPDSVFAQFWEIHPDSVPGPDREHRFIGFFVSLDDSTGRGLMIRDRDRIRLQTRERLHLRLQYYDQDMIRLRLSERLMVVQYWDESQDIWREVPDAVLDQDSNTISFATDELASYYSLFSTASPSSVEDPLADQPHGFVLEQNYPNPFNPATVIPYTVKEAQHVTLSLYDVLGRRVLVLVDGVQTAGSYEVSLDASTLSAGIYLYEMIGGSGRQVRHLVLSK